MIILLELNLSIYTPIQESHTVFLSASQQFVVITSAVILLLLWSACQHAEKFGCWERKQF